MPAPGAKKVDRPAESRGSAAVPPTKSDTPRTSGTSVVGGSVAKNDSSVRSSNPVQNSTPVRSANPAQSGNAIRSGTPAVSQTSVQSSNPAKSGNPVRGGTSVKSNTPTGNISETEKEAADIVLGLKEEIKEYYKTKAKDEGSEVEYAGRFLHNIKHIEKQKLFQAAQKAPKGAHLHIHLNACLEPAFLLELAASEELKHNMYISIDLQDAGKVQKMVELRDKTEAEAKKKTEAEKQKAEAKGLPAPAPVRARKPKNIYPGPLTDANIDKAKFQFHFLPHKWGHTRSLFDPKYCGRIGPTDKADDETYDVMKFTEFLRVFDTHIKKDSDPKRRDAQGKYVAGYRGRLSARCMDWLIKKLVFQEDEVLFTEDKDETAKKTEPKAIERQWAKFNTRTQMMKGLFVAEIAYKKYLYTLFSSFEKDKIQYAELRPNFMAANSVIHTSKPYGIQVTKDAQYPKGFAYDPTKTMDNEAIMTMIIEAFKQWKKNHPNSTFKSMKVIMCTPRARGYPIACIETTMAECLKMKQKDYFKPWIAGFDFVGPEFEGRTLEELGPQFRKFEKDYKDAGLKWILHCGESIYDKPTVDKKGNRWQGNLKWALDNLEVHRLAHGYAIKNANLGEKAMAKLRQCGIETCPSSNEILGLAYNAKYAAVHSLRSKGIPCSVSCDNPTLFNSTLSHEFYQVMVGKDDFGLMGWKKLMMDSLETSAWNENDEDKAKVWTEWQARWEEFVKWIIITFPQNKGSKKP